MATEKLLETYRQQIMKKSSPENAPEISVATAVTTVMVISQEIETQYKIQSILAAQGYQIHVVGDGKSALQEVKNNSPDLILLDVLLPAINGYELCEQLKEDPDTTEIPVIFITDPKENHDLSKCFNVGGIDFISKPIGKQELIARAKTHLKFYSERQQAKSSFPEFNSFESEQRYKMLYHNVKIAIISCTTEGVIVDLNEIALQRINKREADLFGKTLYEVFPSIADDIRQRIQFAVEQETIQEYESYLELDNKPHWSLNVYSIFKDKKGIITGVQIMSLDITESKQLELKLLKSNQLLEVSQKDAKVGAWELDIATNKLFWTAETYRIHDTSPSAFNPTVDEGEGYFLPKSRQIISEALKMAVGNGEGYDLELEKYTFKGRLINIHTTCEVIFKEGKPAKLTGIFKDITEQKLAEKKLSNSEEKFRVLFKENPTPTYIWQFIDNDFELQDYNEAAVDISEGTIKNLLGTKATIFFKEKNQQVLEDFKYCFKHKTTIQKEVFYQMKTGNKFVYLNAKCTYVQPDIIMVQTEDFTYRKKVELKLQQSTQLLEASQKIAKVGGWELDLTTNNLFWTAETYRIHDTSPSDFNPKIAAGVDYFLPESRQIISEALKLAIENGEGYDLELETYTTKGRIIHIRTTCEVTLKEGNPIKLTGIFQDITKQKLAERKLKESEEKFSKAFDNNLVPSTIINLKTGERIAVNRSFCAAFGYSKAELLSGSHKNNNISGDQDKYDLSVEKVLKEGILLDFPFSIRAKSGDIRYTLLNIRKLYPDHDDIFISSHLDITERKKAELDLRETFQRLKLVVDTAKLGIWVLTVKTGGIHWDDKLLEIHGISRQEFDHDEQGWRKLVHPEDKEYTDSRLVEVFDKKPIFDVHFRIIRPGGEIRYIEYSAIPILDEQGELIRIMGINLDITDRVKTEEYTKRTNILLEEMSKTAKVGGWELNVATMKPYFTAEVYKIYGLPETEPPTVENGLKYYTPEIQDIISKAVNHAIEKNISYDLELPIINAQGKKMWVRSIGKAHFENNKAVRVYGAIQDITDQKIAEAKLKESEERFSDAFFNSPIAIAVINLITGERLLVNQVFCDLFGMTQSDALSTSIYENEQVLDHAKFKKGVEKLSKSGYLKNYSIEMFNSSGSIKNIFIGASKMISVDNDVYIISYQDFTEQKNAEKKLKESQQKFKTLFENAPDAVALIDKNGKIIDINRVSEGYDEDYDKAGVIGSNITDFIEGSLSDNFHKAVSEVLETGETQSYESEVIDPKGMKKNWQTRISSFETTLGNEKLFMTFSDITERKRVEAELAEYRLSLEGKVELRTTELQESNVELISTLTTLKQTQVRLIQSAKMVSLGQFTAGIAHEINNPLNYMQNNIFALSNDLEEIIELLDSYRSFINGNNQDIQKIRSLEDKINFEELRPLMRQEIEEIKGGIKRTSEIVNALRDFSVENIGKTKFADIHLGIEKALSVLTGQKKYGITVIKQFDPAISLVKCRIGEINQVFMSLISNAYEAMGVKGTLTIASKLKADCVEISFMDTGSGIKKEDLEKIFDPFFTTKDIGSGTGLGLTMSYGIIESHGGELSVESEEGKASTFIIQFPLNK
jgi:PAS domain S-box-containing protein